MENNGFKDNTAMGVLQKKMIYSVAFYGWQVGTKYCREKNISGQITANKKELL